MTKEYVNIESPFTGGKVYEVHDVEEKTFRGEKYTVNVRYYQCEDTGEQFTTTEQDNLWTSELYSQYRDKHGIPSPQERSSGKLWPKPHYEDGQIPSESNGKMLKIISNPITMMSLLEISRKEFPVSEYERVKGKIALYYFKRFRIMLYNHNAL